MNSNADLARRCRELIRQAKLGTMRVDFREDILLITFADFSPYQSCLEFLREHVFGSSGTIQTHESCLQIQLTSEQHKELKEQYQIWSGFKANRANYLIKNITVKVLDEEGDLDMIRDIKALNFIESITLHPARPKQEMALRFDRKKRYTVKATGVEDRQTRQPQYTPEQKYCYSKPQSFSFINKGLYPPLFKFFLDSIVKVGVCIDIKNVLFNRMFLVDFGTVNRPYDFSSKYDALKFWENFANLGESSILFSDLERFSTALFKLQICLERRKAIKKNLRKTLNHRRRGLSRYNEVLARARWDTDGSSKVIIECSNGCSNLESRLYAQKFSQMLREALIERSRVFADFHTQTDERMFYSFDPEDEIPIFFYYPSSYNYLLSGLQPYDVIDQAIDKDINFYSYDIRKRTDLNQHVNDLSSLNYDTKEDRFKINILLASIQNVEFFEKSDFICAVAYAIVNQRFDYLNTLLDKRRQFFVTLDSDLTKSMQGIQKLKDKIVMISNGVQNPLDLEKIVEKEWEDFQKFEQLAQLLLAVCERYNKSVNNSMVRCIRKNFSTNNKRARLDQLSTLKQIVCNAYENYDQQNFSKLLDKAAHLRDTVQKQHASQLSALFFSTESEFVRLLNLAIQEVEDKKESSFHKMSCTV